MINAIKEKAVPFLYMDSRHIRNIVKNKIKNMELPTMNTKLEPSFNGYLLPNFDPIFSKQPRQPIQFKSRSFKAVEFWIDTEALGISEVRLCQGGLVKDSPAEIWTFENGFGEICLRKIHFQKPARKEGCFF